MKRNHIEKKGLLIKIIIILLFLITQSINSGFIIKSDNNSINITSQTKDIFCLSNKESSTRYENPATEEWNTTFISSEDGIGRYVQQTIDDGYIITGYGEDAGVCHDLCLIKYDKNGNQQWNKFYGFASEIEEGYCVQQTSDDGYIIVGCAHGSQFIWLIKTYNNGSIEWEKYIYGGPYVYHEGHSIDITSDGGYIITGVTAWFEPLQTKKIWLIKTDSYGNIEWQRTFIGINDSKGNSVKQTSDGGFIIAGETDYTPSNSGDIWLIKTDEEGNMVWDKIFGGSNKDCAYCVEQTFDGGYILTGYINGYLTGDIWLIKTDGNGNMIWNKIYGGVNDDWARSVLQCQDGGYYVIGHTYVQNNKLFLPDAWVIKTDDNGNMEWNNTFGGIQSDYAFSGQITKDNGLIITGKTLSYGQSTSGNIWLLKIHVNQPPIANDDFATIIENSTHNTIDVLANDYDSDMNDSLTISAITQPAHGTLSTDGLFVYYTPFLNFYGSDSFTYTIIDSCGFIDTAMCNLTILHLNIPPNKPTITGPEKGKPGSIYKFTITGTDADDDMVYAYITWGDDTFTDWIGPYDSGEQFSVTHTWAEKGTYTVQVKLKDTQDAESDWASLIVIMPFSYEPQFPFISWLLERFPNAFPILRFLLEFNH